MSTGIVQGYPDEVHIVGVRFKVSQKGRERVLREKSKNVHAGVQGARMPATSTVDLTEDGWFEVEYNPYLYDSFVDLDGQPIYTAAEVFMTSGGKVFARKSFHR